MKKTFIVFASLLLIAALLWFWQSNRRIAVEDRPSSAHPIDETSSPVYREKASSEVTTTLVGRDNMDTIEKKMGRRFTDEERKLKPVEMSWYEWGVYVDQHRMKTLKNGTIEFYGRIVTHEGEPIPGVTLNAEVDYYLESIPVKLVTGKASDKKELQIVTDQNGRFSITGEEGFNLQVFGFDKEGFELIAEKNYWGGTFVPGFPNRHFPDPEEPVEFVMQKTGE